VGRVREENAAQAVIAYMPSGLYQQRIMTVNGGCGGSLCDGLLFPSVLGVQLPISIKVCVKCAESLTLYDYARGDGLAGAAAVVSIT